MQITADDLIGQRQRRLLKLQEFKKKGIDPYPAKARKDHPNQYVIDNFEKLENRTVTLSGRLMSWREHGKVIFADLLDQTGQIQIWLKADSLAGKTAGKGMLAWEDLKLLDAGDIVEVTGTVTKTARGEISLLVAGTRLLAKSLRPIPRVITDREELLRRRYLDLLINKDKRELFVRKARFWEAVRRYLTERGFIEVETPVLEHVTGGADARPFVTRHNELDTDFYLRISTELSQKRLIGAGFEKVFTLGPNFRNEGVSEEHLQEYTQVEWYWAYANYEDNMNLVKELFRHLAQVVYGRTRFESRGFVFDLADEWEIIDYTDIIKQKLGIDVFKSADEEMLKVLKKEGVSLSGVINRNRLVDNLWKVIRKKIAGPAFVVNEPKFMSPLAKSRTDNELLTERFHVILAGSELGNGYSEINDPQDQLERFLEQQSLREAGDEEAQMLDIDYVEMLEYGMPPVSGYGQSERVFWFFEDISAREGVLFPQLSFEVDKLTGKIYGNDVIRFTKRHRKD